MAAVVDASHAAVQAQFPRFCAAAAAQGWRLDSTQLGPADVAAVW
jgi:hypothetical protein